MKLLERPCPVCHAQDAAPLFVKLGLALVRCRQCAMVYANPVPLEMATGDFYDAAGGEYLSRDKLESDYADVRFQRELRLFRNFCAKGSVLDVGCSSGGFLYQLNSQFPGDYKILGTDVSSAPLDHAAKMGVPVLRENVLAHQFGEKFDAITFWAVMEHLFEPQRFLRRASELLKPGGLCFILVPNWNSLAIRLLGAKYRYIFPEHINYFSPATLRRFAGKDFDVLELTATHFNPLVIWRDFRSGVRAVPRAERASLLKRTNRYKKSPWLFPVRLAYRASETVLAKGLLADNLVLIGRKK